MSSGIYAAVGPRNTNGNAGEQKLMGVPRLPSKRDLDRQFEWDREVQSVMDIAYDVARGIKRLIPAFSIRVAPFENQQGLSIICELHSTEYNASTVGSFDRHELKDKAFIRQEMVRYAAAAVHTLARQVEWDGGR